MCTDLWKSISFGPAVRKNSPTARHSSPRNISSNVCTLLYLSLHKLIDLACIRGGEDPSLSGRWGLIFFECEWLSGLVIAVLRAINGQGRLNWNYPTFVKYTTKNKKFKADNSILHAISIVPCLLLIPPTPSNPILVLYAKHSHQKSPPKYSSTSARSTLTKADKIFVLVSWSTMFSMWVGSMNCPAQRKLMRTALMALHSTVAGLFRTMW